MRNIDFSRFNKTAFNPFGHEYTLYTCAGRPLSIYVESDTQGDERAATYHLTGDGEIEDNEGFPFSDKFESALLAHLFA